MYELLWGNYESEKFYNFDGPSDYINCGEWLKIEWSFIHKG